ncbi:MAG: hypothetical protein DWQ37_02770 [Planctomycetota bacterium]|nr:MAG: hypothetical protein DWQ37_02770 [Planctomycetota bacterium]
MRAGTPVRVAESNMSKRRAPASAPTVSRRKRGAAPEVVTRDEEFDLLKRLWNFHAQQRATGDAEKVLTAALRLSLDFFGAGEGCVAVVRPGREEADIVSSSPGGARWDRALVAGFLRGHKVSIPQELMLARIRRYDRMWGALVVRGSGVEYHWDARKAFSSIGTAATQLIERIDEQRVAEVRNKIDHKILDQIGPKDLFYQILHGIRSLIAYDHSAALLTCDPDERSLEIVGEQITWRKSKSQKVGLKLALSEQAGELLNHNVVFGFNRDGRAWVDWSDTEGTPLAELLDYNRDDGTLSAEGTMLCAPLITRHGLVGVLKVASVHAGALGAYEVEIISQFLPQVAVALLNMRRTESLEMRMRAAERKQAMADLARAVSHDVNNAIGAVVPLVQQMREDLETGELTADVMRDDLREVERSMQICRRIFGGMLGFARGAARNASEVHLKHEVDATLAVFKEGFSRLGVETVVNVPADLPPLLGIQADIDQVLLNLVGNARDALDSGGRLSIEATPAEGRIDLVIADNGHGIAAENLPKVIEPFFTTKPAGNGLGLSICRSIISQLRGKMRIESTEGQGTTVRLSLPTRQEKTA